VEETDVDFEDHRRQIVEQATLLRDALAGAGPAGAGLGTPVPSCPGWNVAQLLRHLGAGLHWAAGIVAGRATAMPDDTALRVLSPDTAAGPVALGDRLLAGATALSAALGRSGPDPAIWSPVPGGAGFLARRFAHETLLHRADAVLALGRPYAVPPAVAVDALDEWMWLGSLPHVLEFQPEQRTLLGPGRTVHLHATDTVGEWTVDLTGAAIRWRPAHEPAAVTVTGPVRELLLLVYGRRPLGDLPVAGDRELLDSWLSLTTFG
jgi:uncharacterized protein (TIGR03083 family)